VARRNRGLPNRRGRPCRLSRRRRARRIAGTAAALGWTMTRDPRITPEQEAEESSVRFGLVADCGLLVVLVLSGFLGGSLTILAEAIRGSLMSLTELFSLVVMRRIHRGQLADLEFGTGKLEQVANTAIGAAMLGGAVWIVIRALGVLVGERAVGAPFGLAMAAIAGALNAYCNLLAWVRM